MATYTKVPKSSEQAKLSQNYGSDGFLQSKQLLSPLALPFTATLDETLTNGGRDK